MLISIRALLALVVWNGFVWSILGSIAAHATAEESWPREQLQPIVEREIHESALRGHIRFLADDLLEGRGPGSRGDQLAQHYVASELETLGCRPASPDGGWFQRFPLVGITTHAPDEIHVTVNANTLSLRRLDDYVLVSGRPEPNVEMPPTEMIFVGYGIVAPEYQWNDYQGLDVRGKIVLIMNNDPADDPALFAGKTRLYYGRWDYKYETAARQGAAGAIIIHTTASAGYPYQVIQTSWTGEEFELRDQSGPRLQVRGWWTEEATRRALATAGHDLDALRRSAESREFRAVPLGLRWGVSLRNDVRERETANVLGIMPGRDPQLLHESVIFMAHHDHLGLAETRDAHGDNIYNGAVDNASGVGALLTIAKAFARLPERPRRSLLFAVVGAEEQGLLGSAYFAQHPSQPTGTLAAVINIDGVNIWGPSRDVNVIGLGKSNLDQLVQRVATWQQRVVTPDSFPDRGYYYRSDQFSLAKIGVPGVYLHAGIHIVGQPEGWGQQQQEAWVQTTYHQPSDEYRDSWDLRGAVQDTQLLFHTGWQAAEQTALPEWAPNDEFAAARRQALHDVPQKP